jgi:hypothetical protein
LNPVWQRYAELSWHDPVIHCELKSVLRFSGDGHCLLRFHFSLPKYSISESRARLAQGIKAPNAPMRRDPLLPVLFAARKQNPAARSED